MINMALSRLPGSPLVGSIDIVVNPDGTMLPSLLYSTPASILMNQSFFQFWLSERRDVGVTPPNGQWALVTANGKTGIVTHVDNPDLTLGYGQGMLGISD